MKKKLTRAACVITVAATLSVGALAPASAGHNTGDWFNPRGWICSAFPYWC